MWSCTSINHAPAGCLPGDAYACKHLEMPGDVPEDELYESDVGFDTHSPIGRRDQMTGASLRPAFIA